MEDSDICTDTNEETEKEKSESITKWQTPPLISQPAGQRDC